MDSQAEQEQNPGPNLDGESNSDGRCSSTGARYASSYSIFKANLAREPYQRTLNHSTLVFVIKS